MAIEKMKLLRIIAPESRFDEIVAQHILGHEFQPESAMSVMSQSAKTLKRMEGQNPYVELLRTVRDLASKNGIELEYRDFAPLIGQPNDSDEYFHDFAEKLEAMRRERDELTFIANEDEKIVDQLEHIKGMGNVEDVSDFFELEYARFRFGRMPKTSYEHFLSFLEDSNDFYFFLTSEDRDFAYGVYLVPRRHENRVDTLFASLRFERIYISDKVHGSPDEAESELKKEIVDDSARANTIERDIEAYIAAERENFLTRYCLLKYLSEAYDMRKYAVVADDRFFLYGWVPESEVAELEAGLDRAGGIVHQTDDPSMIGDVTPPTKLKNKKFFRPFQPFIEMYGRPNYNEFDPTPFMAVVYTLLYGVMFGDLGQGVLLAICGYLMWKLRGMWIGKVLVYTGISGALVGIAYGSVFGFEDLLPFGFHVLESSANTNTALQFSIYIGLAILTVVMIMNIISGLRRRDYAKALFGQNGIAGLVLFYGVMFILLPMLGYLSISLPGWALILMIVLPLMLIVMREPLGKLVAGDPDWKPESFGSFLVQNLFELIEVVLSYVTNAVSFMRIGIFVISHAAMMGVVFMLAGGHENPNMVVVAIGNVFVMALEALLVAIQVLRLNFYEMFGRFYDGDGREFTPATVDYGSSDN